MWAFLEKFISIVLPRVRDFQGLNPKSFDKKGNYSTGIKEHIIFPEVNPNQTKGIRSLQVNFVFDTNDKSHSLEFLKAVGMPFKK
jgi:large subunit ribosomal protein L5